MSSSKLRERESEREHPAAGEPERGGLRENKPIFFTSFMLCSRLKIR